MFKTPEWGDDVPKLHTSFLKKNEKKVKKPTEAKPQVSLKVNKVKGKKPINDKTQQKQKFRNLKEKKPFAGKTKVFNNNNNKVGENNNTPIKKVIEKKKPFNKPLQKKNSPLKNGINKESRKRKIESPQVKAKKKKTKHSEQTQNLDKIPDTQNFDEILLNAKKKKFNEVIENDDKEEMLFMDNKPSKKKKKSKKNNENNDETKVVPVMNKKDRLKMMIESQTNRSHINVAKKSNQLRDRMMERLKAAQFRYLNEKLYTSSGSEAQQLFQNDPAAFNTYHQGYQLQVKKWPVNPLDVIVKKIMKMPKSHLIADMGCGEAALSRRLPHTVRSFDLVATAPGVEACDMARTPLLTASVDVAVYCLALMGTDLTQYLVEANRVLKMGGHLLIAEVESRFDNVENFTKEVQRLGFRLKQLDKSNNVFFFLEFTKISDPPVKKAKLPALTLKPCIYKRR